VEINRPQALRALAHPLRLDLLELLALLGEATAAGCARRLGTSHASCSFHLRQLAKYGFVVEAEPRGDARERPWRLTDLEQRWSSDGPAAAQLERVFVEREAARMIAWASRSAQEPASWRQAAFLGGMTVPLTADELAEVGERLRAVLEPYVERLAERPRWPADGRAVRLVLSAVPLDETFEQEEPADGDR
jgi:DNA-binding transcriptional ArsR family regulator